MSLYTIKRKTIDFTINDCYNVSVNCLPLTAVSLSRTVNWVCVRGLHGFSCAAFGFFMMILCEKGETSPKSGILLDKTADKGYNKYINPYRR